MQDSSMTIALVSQYLEPDPTLLHLSHETLWSSTYHGEHSLAVYNVKAISSVVAMVAHYPFECSQPRYFLVEKPGLDVASLSGSSQTADEDSCV